MTTMSKILIAGDANLRSNLVEEFAATPEFTVFEAISLTDACEKMIGEAPDVLLMGDDIALPDAGAAIAEIRHSGFAQPILLLACKRPDVEAQQYEWLLRPFLFADLLTRLKFLLRQRDQQKDETFSVGEYSFHPQTGDLTRGESNRVRLTETETAILARLARSRNECVSRDMLLRDVWGYNPTVTTRTLETHIHRLRQKMEREPSKPSLLVTEVGGYRLACRVFGREAGEKMSDKRLRKR